MNSLIESATEKCVRLLSVTKPDGEGGYIEEWKESGEFSAAFDFQTSIEAKSAEKQGVTGLWDIYIPKSVTMEYHNVFKRLSDGQIFRVTSKDDKTTPPAASMSLRKVSAEEWDLA